ncbi:hypothetical protein AB0O07_29190 [Streptomyces sp. NPDC093085]|uniref:hypothetical protein n=1 Tax=Streptomyces sp. NPDC093085 TaxID=3155068 RepID=UPI0034478CAC
MTDSPTTKELEEKLKESFSLITGQIQHLAAEQNSITLGIIDTLKPLQKEVANLRTEVANLTANPEWLASHLLEGKPFSASNQFEYFSNQVFKWDLEAVAFTPTGLTLFGAEVVKFPWVERLRQSGLVSWIQEKLPGWLHAPDTQATHEAEIEQLAQRAHTRIDNMLQMQETQQQKITQTSTSMGRQLGILRGSISQTRGVAETAKSLAKSAHTRIDGINRAQQGRQQRAEAAAGRPSVAAQDPKKLKDAAEQIRALESRVNELARALA